MEMNVSIGESLGVLTEPAPSPSAPSNPAGLQAREEYAKIISDPQHPMYEGFRRGEKSVMNHIDTIYKKAYPDTVPREELSMSTSEREQAGLSATALLPEDAQAVEALRSESEWGAQFEEHLSAARFGSSRLTQARGAEAEDLTTACLDAGLDLKQILKIASHFERRRHEHEQGHH